jgi:hypothetical protein
MLAGHVGVALAIGRVERRINVGVFVAAALLLDVLLWLFILLGFESVTIPPDFEVTRQVAFVFPYSHGLQAATLWSAAAGALGIWAYAGTRQRRWRIGGLVAAAVFSHWLLDALVHRPELPLAGRQSLHVGLGLWNAMPVALAVEAAIVIGGIYLFVPRCGLSRGRAVALMVLCLVVLALTVFGMTLAPPPPSAAAMAATSLLTVVAISALAAWFGRHADKP